MNAATRERVEINRHGADERFAFARGHFRDVSVMQRIAADELHVERNHFPAQRTFAHNDVCAAETAAGIFNNGKSFRQNFFELGREFGFVLDFGKFFFPRGGFSAQFVVGKFLQASLNLIDAGDDRTDFFYVTVILGTENRFEKIHN